MLGHEFMGEVVEVGSPNHKLKKGQRIVVPFQITCGECRQCKMGNWSCCQRSNRNGDMAAATFGYPTAGLFGYSHMTGGYWGGQAEYVRVPMADVSPMVAPDDMSDDDLLFLTDILPTGWQGAEQCQIQGGEIIAIWGAGPVGLFAVQSAKIMGAERIIVIDTVPERLALAKKLGATDVIDFENEDVYERIKEISKGEGADGVIDCVGMEAMAGHGVVSAISKVQEKLTSTQRPYVLNEAIKAVRPGGSVSVPGVYGGPVPLDMGSVVQKGLTIRSGQTSVKRYLGKLTELIQQGRIDMRSMVTHRSTDLSEGPDLYKKFRDKTDGCVKVVFNLA